MAPQTQLGAEYCSLGRVRDPSPKWTRLLASLSRISTIGTKPNPVMTTWTQYWYLSGGIDQIASGMARGGLGEAGNQAGSDN